jgi:hypothetical protein
MIINPKHNAKTYFIAVMKKIIVSKNHAMGIYNQYTCMKRTFLLESFKIGMKKNYRQVKVINA